MHEHLLQQLQSQPWQAVSEYYVDCLANSPKAIAYLKANALFVDPATTQSTESNAVPPLRIGFANRTLGKLIPSKTRKQGKLIRDQLETLGVYRTTGHEHLRGMVTVPLMSTTGQITGLVGRRVDLAEGGAAEQHIGSGIFNALALSQFDEVIITDHVLDAWTLVAAGYRHAVFAVGYELQIADLKQIRRVILAGEHIDCEPFTDCEIHRMQLPVGQTVNSYMLEQRSMTADPLAKLIRSAPFSGKTLAASPVSGKALAAGSSVSGEALAAGSSVSGEALAAGCSLTVEALADELACVEQVCTPSGSQEADADAPNNRPDASAIRLTNVADAVPPNNGPDASAVRLTNVANAVPNNRPDASAVRLTPLASPVPRAADELEVSTTDGEATITIENRRWRLRGLERNSMAGVLKLNLMVSLQVASGSEEFQQPSIAHNVGKDRQACSYTDRFHVDSFDLYHARSRRAFLAEAAEEIGASEQQLRSDLGRVLLKAEQLQHEQRQALKTPAAHAKPLTEVQHAAAMELLHSPNLLERILDDFDRCGIVGERTGKLVGYLAATSRLLERPLGLIIQSSSAAGKSSLAEAILRFMPPEQRFSCSAMTNQSLYYLASEDLKHKILSIAEEEGVRGAAYQLKLLQSEGQLSLVATGKESGTGRTTTQRYEVQGPVQLLLTTTATNIDPELMNRCVVIGIDESPLQTAAIHVQQRHSHTLQGLQQAARAQQIVQQHRDAQRLLRPLRVYNPYAEQLGFAGSQTRHRRDQQKYLTLINTVALLHQYQRPIKTVAVDGNSHEYLEVTRQDIAQANRMADWALGRSIDELPGPTRRLLIELYDWARLRSQVEQLQVAEFRFTRREAREGLEWNATWLRVHLDRLVADEYVVPHGRGQGKLHRYSLLYDGRGREGQPSLLGLVDANSLVDHLP